MRGRSIVACGTQLTRAVGGCGALGRPLADGEIERVTQLACELGATVSGADYIAAIDVVHAVGRQMARFLVPYDMLLSATLGEPPALIGRFPSGRPDDEGGWSDFLDYRLHHVLPYSPVHRARQRHRPTGDVAAAVVERRRSAQSALT